MHQKIQTQRRESLNSEYIVEPTQATHLISRLGDDEFIYSQPEYYESPEQKSTQQEIEVLKECMRNMVGLLLCQMPCADSDAQQCDDGTRGTSHNVA